MHLQRTSRITYGLAKQEHLQARAELLRLKGWGVVVNDDTQCEGAVSVKMRHRRGTQTAALEKALRGRG